MKAHLNAVCAIDLITGVFFAAMGLLVALGALLFAPMFYGAPLWKPSDQAGVVAVILLVSGVLVAIGIPPLIAGIGLWKQKPWARTLAIVVAALALASFPVGTVAGLYALWVLTQAEAEQLLRAAG